MPPWDAYQTAPAKPWDRFKEPAATPVAATAPAAPSGAPEVPFKQAGDVQAAPDGRGPWERFTGDVSEAFQEGVSAGPKGITDEDLPTMPRTRAALKAVVNPLAAGASLASGAVRGGAAAVGGAIREGGKALGIDRAERFGQQVEGDLNLAATMPPVGRFAVAPAVKAGRAAVTGAEEAAQAARDSKIGAAAQAIKETYNPEGGRPKAQETAARVRRVEGQEARDAAIRNDAVKQVGGFVSKLPPEQQLALIDHIEGGGASPLPKEMAPVATALRDTYKFYEGKLKEAKPDMEFVENYMNHLWKRDTPQQKDAVASFIAKQGATGFTKARRIPTYAEGIKAGLTPVTTDPLQIAGIYVENAKKYIAAERIFSEMRENGDVKFYAPGQQPAGWVPLEGRLSRKPARDIVQGKETTRIPERLAYAPPEAALIYNNHISRGLSGKPLYEAARAASMGMTAAELSLSGYHWTAETIHSMASDVAKGLRELSLGRPLVGAKDIARGVTPGATPVANMRLGKKVLDTYLGRTADVAPESQKVVDALTDANFGFSRDKFYKVQQQGERSWRDMARQFKTESPMRKGKTAFQAAGKIMDTVSKPLFEIYVPRLKMAAAYREVAGFMERKPNATPEEITAFARQVSDSMDNRLGVMMQDNLFWNKTFKQLVQITERAPTWNVGVIREALGGVGDAAKMLKDLPEGKYEGLPLRTSYALGMMMVLGVLDAGMSYLHGQDPTPQDARDLISYRTGGETPKGDPERGFLPGQHHDVIGWAHDPLHEAWNKAASALVGTVENVRNEDWRGDPIADPTAPLPTRLMQHAGDMAGRYAPLSLEMMRRKAGSNLSLPERLAGVRSTSAYLTAPDRVQSYEERAAAKALQKRARNQQRDKDSYE